MKCEPFIVNALFDQIVRNLGDSVAADLVWGSAVKTLGWEKDWASALAPPRPDNLVVYVVEGNLRAAPLKEIWNKWPGDESIEEILGALN